MENFINNVLDISSSDNEYDIESGNKSDHEFNDYFEED